MTDYFTTSELAYARLAILHGFEGCESLIDLADFGGVSKTSQIIAKWNPSAHHWRFPKTPHNVRLEKHCVGDVIVVPGDEPCVHTIESISDGRAYFWGGFVVVADATIIYRTINGKPTPFPVWDEESA